MFVSIVYLLFKNIFWFLFTNHRPSLKEAQIFYSWLRLYNYAILFFLSFWFDLKLTLIILGASFF